MKKLLLVTLLAAPAHADESCWLVRDVKSGRAVEEEGKLCKQRLPPCSTFKLPLAVMAFDAKILDEKTVLKWDKTPQHLKQWEKDHDVTSWLRESVVWFSQRLTTQLGLPKVQQYLKTFDYGNQDFSGGLTTAWLGSTLRISGDEQVALLVKLKQGALFPDAVKRTLAVLPTEAGGVSGKTGSCGATDKEPYRVGWYVGYRGDQAFAYVFTSASAPPYAGLEAKKRVLARYQEMRKSPASTTQDAPGGK
jgi:beta-lactamase class D